ncbi:alpha/beta hydrolase [Kitasatospora sp. SUK 42]|uniref:alpha/beta hydrolase n=1 Tax=Kitasatospora sp. SUK 42 TaxID=1588882 RepID=UPI0018CA7BBD|nr:alpha/beta hydrolase [Kitasatospora sp. SUK 42]MBV2151537.1 alpha/beta hydrolase [Kitasatospora sp. SUK 42]
MTIPLPVRIQAAFLRGVYALPDAARRALAGRPVVVDGQTLALDAQLMLRLQRLSKVALVLPGGVGPSRVALEYGRHLVGGPVIRRVSVREVGIPVEHGELAATLYTPDGLAEGSGLLVFLHGGGWVLGSRASHDHISRFLARRGRVRVLSVEYRRPPEHVFPAAVEDALAAFDYAHAKAADLGADPERIAVGGDSAGGNLAAVTAQTTVRRGGPAPVFQLLLYPAVDASVWRRSRELFADGYYLTSANMDWFADHYVPAPADRTDPRLSPLLAEDLTGLPPAYIGTAGFDPLRDEGEAYARALEEAGVEVRLSRHPDLIHGYASYLGTGRRFREATAEAADALRGALGRASGGAPGGVA